MPPSPTATRRRAVAAFAAAPLLAALAGRSPARAQQQQQHFPSRPLRVVVPFPPGQSNDIFARLLADKASELRWPQNRVVVEDRAGAGGTIGMGAVAQAAPDGHTLVFGSLATLAINPAAMRAVPYDPERDFAPVIRVFEGPLLVVVPAKGPDPDLPALVRRLRGAGDGKLTYASSGPGSTQHMSTELLLQGIGARATHVPYTDPAVRARFAEAGVTPLAEKPEAFAAFIRSELAKWREVARRGEVVLD